jgi:uncharacterized membrane protein
VKTNNDDFEEYGGSDDVLTFYMLNVVSFAMTLSPENEILHASSWRIGLPQCYHFRLSNLTGSPDIIVIVCVFLVRVSGGILFFFMSNKN